MLSNRYPQHARPTLGLLVCLFACLFQALAWASMPVPIAVSTGERVVICTANGMQSLSLADFKARTGQSQDDREAPDASPGCALCAFVGGLALTPDRLSVAAGVSSFELMGNAGAAVAREIECRWTPRPLLVLCGPGNNGGDGFVVAHLLAEAGWPVRVAMLGSRVNLHAEARQHVQRWGGEVEALSPSVLGGAELVVDTLFGAGLSRPLEGRALDTLLAAGRGCVPIVAIDTPSGVMGDTGEALGAVKAVLTVTFFRKKPGHLLLPGRDLCGEVVVADIGTPKSVLDVIAPLAFENHPALWLADLPRVHADSNKHSHGHALVFGGYPMTGAARMAARGAARAGAGLTSIAVPEIALPVYAATLNSIMVHRNHGFTSAQSALPAWSNT